MPRSRTEIRVGITVFSAAIILIGTLLWIKGFQYGTQNYPLDILFPNVGLLETGDPVLVSGVNRGKVKAIKLYEGQVLITVEIGNDVDLRSDAEFAIKTIGLMGERYIDVKPGVAEDPLNHSLPAIGGYDTGIPEVMGVMGRMVEETRELVSAIRDAFVSDSSLSDFVHIIGNTRKLTEELQGIISENRQDLRHASADFASVAGRLNDIAIQNEDQITHSIGQFDTASTALVAVASRLDSLTTSLNGLVGQVERGEGTLGLLVSDTELYDQLKTAAQDLDVLLAEIRANPRKFLRLKVSLF